MAPCLTQEDFIFNGLGADQLSSGSLRTPRGTQALALPLQLAQAASSPPPLRVYSRRRLRRAAANAVEAADSPAKAFLLKIAKSPNGLLPIPHINKRRKKPSAPPSEAPRRSRRIAGMQVEKVEDCPKHLKKCIMRALDLNVDEDKETLGQQLLDEYAQHFRQHITPSHTRALAALFGWAPTEEDFVVGSEVCLV